MSDIKKILTFLDGFSKNNNREWFHENTQVRKQANLAFEGLVGELEHEIMNFDYTIKFHAPKELTFRQVRDLRFSKDKTPYHPIFRAHIAPAGKLPIPVGYFICIKPNDGSFVGGGLFTDQFSEATNQIRDYLSAHPQEFEAIINNDLFKENFTVKGTKLKNVPKAYDSDSAIAEYLKYKSWYLEYKITDQELLTADNLVNLLAEKFALMKDFNDFLNKALVDFKMPERKK
ncbi:uncharacterized protein (TIGR02453 family) [Enterococcus sp. PF1-24]|uniref:DUF2461 domain-containing protein n=1 Tax=unclassified Enterococcus TaxID=2608891 RepID=UPI002475C614|nr:MULTISPECIES: DUF2461 domain-containing protein [unclassified Enterococcus]MDH6363896.1 uncharacterized protein (TIGR02453 family) [Enterococcus sp. PFB1-1]MDH6400918.1 uncharacterized protein (TIGR02453 family) [Enterococcus sp. PF1-24]